ncbi:hypothetical protein WA171_006917 [Blastocystis sp. BT1]
MIRELSLDGFPNRKVYYSILRRHEENVDYSLANNDSSVSFVAIDAEMVYGINHLLVACMKVINREESGKKFISGDMNREIIYSLSPTKNLKEALNLFSAKADCSFVLLVSLDSGDAIKSFIEENHLHEEERDDVLSKVKPEAKKNSIIEHFGITENELSFYSLPDLVQMGVAMKNV